jgi:5-methyltetrahydrofolate--homocysteine methyltransferase
MPDIMKRLGREMLVLEGAMGTMLQRMEMTDPSICPEHLNLVEPNTITRIHANYAFAGADCAISNTFGASRPKLAQYGLEDQLIDINRAGVKCARAGGAPHVLADMGPTGLVMAPLGDSTFEEVYWVFSRQAAALAAEKPDAFLLETFTDIAEVRAAIIACKSTAPDIPVIASITCNSQGRMDLSGTDPATAAIIMEAAGADAVGLNCGLGTSQMADLIESMVAATRLPVIAQPNAGMPTVDSWGKAVFSGTADEMGVFALLARVCGVAAVGSCCGSSPSFTGAIADEISGHLCIPREGRGFDTPVLAGPRGHVVIGEGETKLIGERINPTGKLDFSAELAAGVFDTALALARQQERDGAHLLDINVGAAGVDEAVILPAVVEAVTAVTNLPLVIDTSNVQALNAALRIYPGRALINSVNGDPASYSQILPLAKRYGACLVALALDENGIGKTARDRMGVIESIRLQAREYGFADDRLVVDSLVLSQATDSDAPTVTLETMKLAREAGLATILGISNVSFGMPDRAKANVRFFAQAKEIGLDAAIVNVEEMTNVATEDSKIDAVDGHVDAKTDDNVYVPEDITQLSMTALAEKFKSGEIFLPQLMHAIDVMKKRKEEWKALDGASGQSSESSVGTVVFATVHGDIHSIGKDICVALLESQDFEVIDLGVDVPVEKIVETAREVEPIAVCLSALMTTTLPSMKETKEALRKAVPEVPVCVGGAVVTQAWADGVGAYYSADAPSCVTLVESVKKNA